MIGLDEPCEHGYPKYVRYSVAIDGSLNVKQRVFCYWCVRKQTPNMRPLIAQQTSLGGF